MVTMVETRVDDIPKEFRINLEESAEKIRRLSKHTVEGLVEIGRELKWVKAHLEHGLWEKWVREELGWHPSTAWRFMQAATRFENLASTQELDEEAFLEQLWGNIQRDSKPKSQEDALKWLERQLDRLNQNTCHILRKLTFCNYLTPTVVEKLRNLAQTLTDVVKSHEAKVNINPN